MALDYGGLIQAALQQKERERAAGAREGTAPGIPFEMNVQNLGSPWEDEQKDFNFREKLLALSALNPKLANYVQLRSSQLEQEKMRSAIGQYIALTEQGIVGKDPRKDLLIATDLGISPDVVQRLAMIGSELSQSAEMEKGRAYKTSERLDEEQFKVSQATEEEKNKEKRSQREALIRMLDLMGTVTPTSEQATLLPGQIQGGKPLTRLPKSEVDIYAMEGLPALTKYKSETLPSRISFNEKTGRVLLVNPITDAITQKYIPGFASPIEKKQGKKRVDLYNREVSAFNSKVQQNMLNLRTQISDETELQTKLNNLEQYRTGEVQKIFKKYWPNQDLPTNLTNTYMDEEDLEATLGLIRGTKEKEEKFKQKTIVDKQARSTQLDTQRALEMQRKRKRERIEMEAEIADRERKKARKKMLNPLQNLIEGITGEEIY